MTDDELREYMEEWRDFGYLFIRARWTMDGAKTLIEAAQRFRDRAETLEDCGPTQSELAERDAKILERFFNRKSNPEGSQS